MKQLWNFVVNGIDAAEEDFQQSVGHSFHEHHALLAHALPTRPTLHHPTVLQLSRCCLPANAFGEGAAIGDLLMYEEECIVGVEEGVDVGG